MQTFSSDEYVGGFKVSYVEATSKLPIVPFFIDSEPLIIPEKGDNIGFRNVCYKVKDIVYNPKDREIVCIIG